MPTYGRRPQDVVTDSRGNALNGILLKLYATEALALAGGTPLETVTTDSSGRWLYETVSTGELWARLPSGAVWQITAGEAGGGVTDHGLLTGLADDDHTQYALASGARGAFAAPLGADDNYVTDAEKVKLSNLSGTNTGDQTLPTWGTISGKPAVVAEGADQAAARTSISAAAASHTHAAADVTSGTLAVAQIGTGTAAAGKYVDGGTGAWTALPASSAALDDLTDVATAGQAAGEALVSNGTTWGPSVGPAVLSADSSVLQVVAITQAAYNALSPPVSTTLYVVTP